jgi:hypothetical protein
LRAQPLVDLVLKSKPFDHGFVGGPLDEDPTSVRQDCYRALGGRISTVDTPKLDDWGKKI